MIRDQREPVGEVIAAAFGGRGDVDLLAAELAAGDGHVASLVAAADGMVVGHVQLSRGWVDAPDRIVPVAILSPLSVLPTWQGRGIGGALVRASIARVRQVGFPALFLEGSPLYYPRFGFVPGTDHGFTAPSVRIPPAAFQVVLLPAYDPSVRGALVYPEPFWKRDAVGLR